MQICDAKWDATDEVFCARASMAIGKARVVGRVLPEKKLDASIDH
jgi:hypothetical protein